MLLRGDVGEVGQAGELDEHHAELARILLGQYDALTVQIGALTQHRPLGTPRA
jgi:hypothetical protein